MLNRKRHQIILVKLLKEIYSKPDLRNVLGLKGGTAAYLFYGLPRFSVDLDFDLLDKGKKEVVLKKMPLVLSRFGEVKESIEKRHTLFFLLSYGKGERNVKVEVSKRETAASFSVRNYLGIPALVMDKEDMVAGKISALLTRRKFAARDLFDLWFFLKNDWDINPEIVKEKTGCSLKAALEKAIGIVGKTKRRQMLQGVGELINAKQKKWVRESLREELLFHLRLYLATLESKV